MSVIKITKEKRIDVLWDKYIAECKLSGYAEDTLRNKEHYFSVFYEFLNGNHEVDKLTQEILNRFTEARIATGIKEISVNSCSVVLNAFLRWLYEHSYTKTPLKIQKLKVQQTVKETYTSEELKRLLIKPDLTPDAFSDYRTWVIINYILGTGNRLSSVLTLKICDIDLESGYVRLAHTKNKNSQLTPLPSSLIFILKDYLDIRGGNKEDFLFCTLHGKQLTRSGANKALLRYCDRRMVDSLGHHAFRHTFAKISVRDCHIDSFRLQRLLGHKNIKTTEHYVHLYADDLRENLDTYNPLEHLLQQNQPKERIRLKGGRA